MNSVRTMTLFVLLVLCVPFCAAVDTDVKDPEISGKPAGVKYPYVAEVTGANVNIRSGKGTAYYECAKAQLGEKVTVFEEVFGWAKILPPKGCYSWINKDGVDVEDDNPTVGVLSESVRVWAGSDYIQPMRSSSMQTKLNPGEIVTLLPNQPENSEYYKIKPPAGAFLWISCEFLKYFGPVQLAKPIPVKPKPSGLELPGKGDLPPANETSLPKFKNLNEGGLTTAASNKLADPNQTRKAESAIKSPTPGTPEAKLLETCYALSAKIDQQLQLPLAIQDYTDIRNKLAAVKANAQAGQAATYAQILQERIKRYELAISVVNTLKEQDKSLEKRRVQIEKTHQENLEKLPKDTNYLFAGLLKKSHVYTAKTGQQRYLLLDSSGRILCYVVPASESTAAKLKSMIGLKVGIRGNVSNDKNALKTLVSITSIDLLQ